MKTLFDLAKLAEKSEICSFPEEAQTCSPTLWPKPAAQAFYCTFCFPSKTKQNFLGGGTKGRKYYLLYTFISGKLSSPCSMRSQLGWWWKTAANKCVEWINVLCDGGKRAQLCRTDLVITGWARLREGQHRLSASSAANCALVLKKKKKERMSRERGKTEENMHLEQKNWQNMSCYKLESCFLEWIWLQKQLASCHMLGQLCQTVQQHIIFVIAQKVILSPE